jgi:hypothetical protein
VYITQGVFLGLLRQAQAAFECSTAGSEEQLQSSNPALPRVVKPILEICKDQPYGDGTLFLVNDIRGLCSVLGRAYMLLSTDAAAVASVADEIDTFIDFNLSHAAEGERCGAQLLGSRACTPWTSLKKGIKDAGVQPMDLVRRNMEIEEVGFEKTYDGARWDSEKFVLKKKDWYLQVCGAWVQCFFSDPAVLVFFHPCLFCLQRDWFMAHLIVNTSSSSGGGATNAIVSYKDWGVLGSAEDPDACIVSRPARDKGSRLARDMRIAAGLTDPLGFYEDGSPELARVFFFQEWGAKVVAREVLIALSSFLRWAAL